MPEGKPKFQQQEATNPGEFPHTVTPEGNIYDKTSLEEAAAQGKLTPIDAFVDDDGRIHINPLQYAPADAKYRESIPNNSPTGQSEQYSHVPTKNPGLWLKDSSEGEKGWGRLTGKSKVAIAGAAVALIVTGYGAKQVLDAKSFVNELADANNDRGISAPLVPGEEITPALVGDYNGDGIITSEEYDMMPPSVYKDLDQKIRIEDTAENLNKYLPDAWESLQGYLTSEEASILSIPNTNLPRNNWSDQDYLNNYTISLYLVSAQGNTQEQINEGRRALSVVIDPSNSGFSTTTEMIGQVNSIKNVYEALPSEYTDRELEDGTLISSNGRVEANGGRIVKARDVNTDEINYMVFVNHNNSKGDIVSPLEGMYSSSSLLKQSVK